MTNQYACQFPLNVLSQLRPLVFIFAIVASILPLRSRGTAKSGDRSRRCKPRPATGRDGGQAEMHLPAIRAIFAPATGGGDCEWASSSYSVGVYCPLKSVQSWS
jgi:hypothetical protein